MLDLAPVFDRLFRVAPVSLVRHREEVERIVRFVLIGGASFVFNAGLYVLISRVLWPTGNRTFENFVATAITCILNYLAHRAWTFRSQGAHSQQAVRYVFVAVSAIFLQSGLFWVGYRLLGWHDFIVIFVVAVLIPFYTYVAHKLFTFRLPRMVS